MKTALGLGVVAVLLAGCGEEPDYVTREELVREFQQQGDIRVITSLVEALKTQREVQAQLQRLHEQALTSPSIAERSAAILASTEQANGNLTKTLEAVSLAMDVITNNLLNLNTIAYKKQWARVEGSRPVIIRDFGQGDVDPTGRKLDLAIEGEGFFRIILDRSGAIGYTRNGFFERRPDGILCDFSGHVLEPQLKIDPLVPSSPRRTSVSTRTDGWRS